MASGDCEGGLHQIMANVLSQCKISEDSLQNESTRVRPVKSRSAIEHDQNAAGGSKPPADIVDDNVANRPLSRGQESNVEYLTELWQDLQKLNSNSDADLSHARSVLMKEIDRVWAEMCMADMQYQGYAHVMPDAGFWPMTANTPHMSYHVDAPPPPPEFVRLEETIPVPTDKYPNYNFIGRILGPRGMSVKQLEQDTQCRILVRGKGSVRDPRREQRLLGKKGWEHLSLPLHISVSATAYTREAANQILQHGVHRVTKLLCPAARDESKRRQLMELAIINGNYRPVLYETFVPHV